MPRRAVVFLGPSLSRNEAEAVVAAEFRPPAKRGDVLAAADDGAAIIVLIDGVFFQDCSVAHREILAVLKRGITVIGASSMGALRAAELDTFGMIGVGEIYRRFKNGELEADDEVALTFDPLFYGPLSEPLITVRANIDRAVREHILTVEEGSRIIEGVRALYFPKRTWENILAIVTEQLGEDPARRLRLFLAEGCADPKRDDALEALAMVREMVRK
jgi:hypothetical protein